MSFKPLSDNVLVEQQEAKTQTASGLILPFQMLKNHNEQLLLQSDLESVSKMVRVLR